MVSILLPVFNAAPYLEACLVSIQAQTFTNWELLAVDDFSTDESLVILQRFQAEDARIKVFSNTEKGIIPALRLAFEQAAGRHITRMDADDLMPPFKLERLRDGLVQQGPGTLLVGKVRYFSAAELGEGYQKYANWLNEQMQSGNVYAEIYKECIIPSPCWMVHREALLRASAFEPDRYPEDYDLCFRFYEAGLKVVLAPGILHWWRDHGSRASRNDPHYADNHFFQLKVPYFLKLDRDPKRPLVLWGAGQKGKLLARLLQQAGVDFHWICNTPRKWKAPIYGISLHPPASLHRLAHPQILVAVAAVGAQAELIDEFSRKGWLAGKDYFLFC